MHYGVINSTNTISNGYLHCDPIVMEVPSIKIPYTSTVITILLSRTTYSSNFVHYVSVNYHPSDCTHDMAITSTDACLRRSHLIYKICFSGYITSHYCGHTE